MRKCLLFIFVSILCSFNVKAQPPSYSGGMKTWFFNGRYHAYYHSPGFDYTKDMTYWVFGGLGQDEFDSSTLKTIAPYFLLTAGQDWNGLTTAPGGTLRCRIIVVGDQGSFDNSYANDFTYAFANMPSDTANHTIFTSVGISIGVSNMWTFLLNRNSIGNAYRNIFGVTVSMSGTSVTNGSDLQTWATGRRHMVFYGNPAGDGNAGTPFAFSQFLYSDLPGTPNVTKRLKWNPTGTHSNNTWGQVSNINSFFNNVGTDSSNNGFIYTAYAYGDPFTNLGPTAVAGPNQVVGCGATTTTLDGSGSYDTDGSIVSYAWTKISGPSGGTITSPSSATTGITGLNAGLYAYRLLVTDNEGATDDDTVEIFQTTICPSTNRIVLSPSDDHMPWSGNGRMNLFVTPGNGKKIDTLSSIYSYELPIIDIFQLGDSNYNHLKIQMRNGTGVANQIWRADVYDSLRNNLWNTTFDQSYFPQNAWMTVPGSPDTISKAARYVKFTLNTATSFVTEIAIYGDKVSKASTFVSKIITPTVLTDPGIKHLGMSDIGNIDTTTILLASGLPLAGAFRHPNNEGVWKHNWTNTFSNQNFVIDTYGSMAPILIFNKRHGVAGSMYNNGASIKASSLTDSSYSIMSTLNLLKDIPKGTDSTSSAQWALNSAKTFGILAGLWGNNPSANLSRFTIGRNFGSSSLASGQGFLQYLELDNEPDKDFVNTPSYGQAYMSPEVQHAKYRAAHDTIVAIDPSMKTSAGALYSADTMKFKALAVIDFWKTGIKNNSPFDRLSFNQYMSNNYGGQPQSNGQAISPEQFRTAEQMVTFGRFRDRYFPGMDMQWTEIGYSITTSPYQVFAVTGMADSVVAAAMQMRATEQAMRVPNVVTTVYQYKYTSDGSSPFGGMRMLLMKFSFPVVEIYKNPTWYAYALRSNTLWNYKGWSTTIVDGDSTSVSLVRRDHNSNPLLKAYTVWKGTYSGSTTSNYVVNVGNAQSATLVTWAQGDEDGVSTSLTITNGQVTIPTVSEMPAYLMVQLKTTTPPYPFRVKGLRYKMKN